MTHASIETKSFPKALAYPSAEPLPSYSIVVPVHDEAAVLPELYCRICEVMERTGEPWELILVNDGSRDSSPEEIEELCADDPRVRGISLSRNFGFQIAVTAGLESARGQAVITMDADLQDPPEVIPEMIAQWRKGGFDMVYGVRSERAGETWFKQITARVFYRLIHKLTNGSIPMDTGDFRLMDRRVVEAVLQMPEKNRFLRGMISWVGFKQTGVHYKREPRYAGETKFTLKKMLRFAMDAISGFSYLPLQLASFTGLGVTLTSLLVTAAIILLHAVGTLPAWPDLLIILTAVFFAGGVQLIFLGIIGEYLGRIYDEVKGRPLYLVEHRWGFDR